MREGKDSRGVFRLLALGLVLVLGAYWAGSRWGERQPQSVGAVPAVPASFPESKPEALLGDEVIYVKIYSQSAPAVANIVTRTLEYDVFMEPVPVEGAGSGFVIDPRGYILTNFHVVQNAQAISVTLGDRTHYDAKFIGADERNDIALVKIDPKDRKLPVLTMGDSESLLVGQRVLAIGNPFGFQSTLTTGVVSALGRTVQTGQATVIDGAIQTDAAINQGNSGGPLLNSHGEVIGINSAIYTPSGTTAGIGFAIPISTARQIAQDLITDGRVHRASMGVEARLLTPAVAEALHLPVNEGLMIERVTPGGPAANAGLKGGDHQAILGMRRILLGGDVITGIDGRPITAQTDLTLALNRKRPGDTVTVEYYRGTQKMTAKVTLNDASR
ncbi:MAG TPA: trypsin-like peptidase domain-containing protein [Candidatus Saccharimonadales bacterium]|jgi:S1-C subfamily serine protease|nr:trypsin-like peptidase domain-containing protein [Candidatus Saccharimonadales bacterium]